MKPPLDCSEKLKVFFSHRGLISFSFLFCQIVESWRSDRANLSSDLIGGGQEAGEGRTPSDQHSYENIATRQDLLFNTGQFDKNIALYAAREFREGQMGLVNLLP